MSPNAGLDTFQALPYIILTALDLENKHACVTELADFIFWAPKSLQMVIAAMKLKDANSLEEKL